MQRPTPSPSSPSRVLASIVTLVVITITLSVVSRAQTESIIYSASSAPGPQTPEAGLIFDPAGNLYGTTLLGGVHNLGTVFELSPVSGGGWQETTIHSFTGGDDGGNPASSLVIDGAGNLYGTTSGGGTKASGTVFELSPLAGGGWHETVLHSLNGRDDGWLPLSGLVFDSSGNLYGTASQGGAHGWGTVFELSRTGGVWSFTVIFSFGGGGEGAEPEAGLTFDSSGNLYGTTSGGGQHCAASPDGCGLVFELSPLKGGGWHESILHRFTNTDGAVPLAGVVFDQLGNLYGTTSEGGDQDECASTTSDGCGIVFELSPEISGWHETILHEFTGFSDGRFPGSGLIIDARGHLYGTTELGGDSSAAGCDPDGCGVIFELAPATDGRWREVVLHDFTQAPDGSSPVGSLVFDSFENVYGTTSGAGAFGAGTVFEVIP